MEIREILIDTFSTLFIQHLDLLVILSGTLFLLFWATTGKKKYSEKRELVKCESPIETQLFQALRKKDYQVYTQIPCKNYRIDLAIYTGRRKIAIEADGKKYHSSIDQLKHDKEKDWQLRKHGWEVIRFTGSEIYRNSSHCVKEIEKLM